MSDILIAGGGIVTAGGGIAFAAPPPPTEFAPTDIVFSSVTIPYNAASGDTVCTLSAPGATEPVTYSIVGGTDAALFSVDGAALKRSASGSVSIDDTLQVQVRAENSVGHYDETHTFTAIDPAAENLITVLTVTNRTGNTVTNEPVVFGLPVGPGVVGDTDTINVYDDDGSGGKGDRLANFQTDNWSSNLNEERRFVSVAGILPSIGANATRKIQLYRSVASQPTGTEITDSDILALGGMANGGAKVTQVVSGTAYTATLADAMAGGTSFSKTAACKHGSWRSGPAYREAIYSIPLTNSGTPHLSGDGLRAYFHVHAAKAGSAAVSGGNPITKLRIRVEVRNGHRTAASDFTVDSGSVEYATSLSDPTLIKTSKTHPLTGETVTYDFTSSYTCWKGSGWSRECWIGEMPLVIATLGDDTSAITATTKALYNYLALTAKAIPNNKRGPSDISQTSEINALNLWPTTKPLQVNTSGGSKMGTYLLQEGAAGGRAEIGLLNAWDVNGLVKWNQDGRRAIFASTELLLSQKLQAQSLNYSSSTKRFYELSDSEWPAEFNETASDPWQYDLSHEGCRSYVPYILRGEYVDYFVMLAHNIGRMGYGSRYNGEGENHTLYGDYSEGGKFVCYYAADLVGRIGSGWSSGQTRGIAWGTRSIAHRALLTPDRFAVGDQLSASKPGAIQWLQRHLARAAAICVANTGPESTYFHYGTHGPRWTHKGSDNWVRVWQFGYFVNAVAHLRDLHGSDADLTILLEWLADYYRDAYAYTGWAPDFGPFNHYAWKHTDSEDNYGNPYLDFGSWYDRNRTGAANHSSHGDSADMRWLNTGTLTLDKTSGTDIIATWTGNPITPALASWYIGCHVITHTGSGRGKIVAVGGANQVTLDTTQTDGATFSTTSYSTTRSWSLPAPHPDDAPAEGTREIGGSPRVNGNYVDISRSSAYLLKEAGCSGLDDVIAYLNGWKPNSDTDGTHFDWRTRS